MAKTSNEDNTNKELRALRLKNLNKLIIAHLNINSLRNKFDLLNFQIKDNVDILMLSETKVDESFPNSQFLINGFSTPYRFDRNARGGGIFLYIREDIPSRLLSSETSPIEGFFVELNLRNKKWLICCSYNPKKALISDHLSALSKTTDVYTSKYDNLLFLGDFNAGIEDTSVRDFCRNYNLTSMINKPTCYKNPNQPSCIDLILTNCPNSFQHSCTVETGLSDFHKMTITVMKTTYKKLEPRIINYRDFKSFCNDSFRESLQQALSITSVNGCDEAYKGFITSCKKSLESHAPLKKKYVRGNQSPFMNKDLSKAIMVRTKLRNIFLKNRTEENKINYNKQRNLCVALLRKSKREYYQNLNVASVCDNKKFWKVVKPLLSNKIVSNEKITLVEKSEILKSDKETAKVLNNFFLQYYSKSKYLRI